SKEGRMASFKKVFKIDIKKATDISDVKALPEKAIPKKVKPVSKSVFLDLLDPAHGLAGPDCPAKIEGLAFGPDLPDGRHLLLVTTDNDFLAKEPTKILAFAVDPKDLPKLQSQAFDRSR